MFRQYIINLFNRSATARRSTRILLMPVGATIFFGFIAVLILAARWLDFHMSLPSMISSPANKILALLLAIPGAALVLWCDLRFLRAHGTPVPFNPPQELVETGPYAFTRNPILTGIFAILFAVGVWLNSISLIFIFTPLFILITAAEVKLIEEPELEKRFGNVYLAYKSRVPMFFPRLPRR